MTDELDARGLKAAAAPNRPTDYQVGVAHGRREAYRRAIEWARTIRDKGAGFDDLIGCLQAEEMNPPQFEPPRSLPEPDRIAVVVDRDGVGHAKFVNGSHSEDNWRLMQNLAASTGPFARAIVECRLPRPAEPVTVQGRVVR